MSVTDKGIQGATFYENDNTRLMWDVANQLTEDGKINPDVAKAFPPEWAPEFRYKIGLGKGVDPSDVEAFVTAWLRYALANKAMFSAKLARQSMIEASLNPAKSAMVANAMMRLQSSGKLNPIATNPVQWQAENSAFDPLAGVKGLTAWTPWLLAGLALWVAYPYLKAFRTPGQLLSKARA